MQSNIIYETQLNTHSPHNVVVVSGVEPLIFSLSGRCLYHLATQLFADTVRIELTPWVLETHWLP